MIILGIDPGAGTKSATGVAFYDPVGATFKTLEIWPYERKSDIISRIRSIAEQFQIVTQVEKISVASIESFVMRGVGGQSLQRLIGALLIQLNTEVEIVEVPNTIVKQVIGGSGRSDKEAVAHGLQSYFLKKNKGSAEQVMHLKNTMQYDALDALAIAVAGYLRLSRG